MDSLLSLQASKRHCQALVLLHVCAAAVRAFLSLVLQESSQELRHNSTGEVEEALEGQILWCQLPLH